MHGLDLLLLASKALLLAAIPLAYVMYRQTDGVKRYRRLAWLTAFLTLDLIIFGAFTRLTDSGLGCPDWPGCYAKANPWAAAANIQAAEILLPSGPVTLAKAWIEMIHRYLAMAIGVLIIVLCALAWRRYSCHRSARAAMGKPWGISAILGLIILQGAFGAWTVTLRLQPIIVTTHLLLGMLLLASLVHHAAASSPPSLLHEQPAKKLWTMAALLLFLQIALGGWVSSNYAALACQEFPGCQGALWPELLDFKAGFQLWRPLGKTADGAYLPFPALVAIHWTHRLSAALLTIALGILIRQLWASKANQRYAVGLLVLLIFQWLTGISNVIFSWPLFAAVLHNAGAAGLVWVLVLCKPQHLFSLPKN